MFHVLTDSKHREKRDSASYGVSPYPTVETHVSELPRTFISTVSSGACAGAAKLTCDGYVNVMSKLCVQTF